MKTANSGKKEILEVRNADGKLYTIGQVSKLSGIPISTLRYYDKSEIIVPAVRNETSHYRYYDQRQLENLIVLGELKQIGLSLNDIREFIQSQDHSILEDAILNAIQDAKNEIRNLNDRISSMDMLYQRIRQYRNQNSSARIETGDAPAVTDRSIEVKTLEQVWVLSTRYESFLDVDHLFLKRVFELQKIRSGYGLFSAGPYIAVFHGGYDKQFSREMGDLEVCVPVIKPDKFKCPELKVYGGYLAAGTVHEGSYHSLEESYEFLINWIKENNYAIAGPSSEFYYMDSSSSVNERDYVTKIYFPVKPST